MLRWGVRAGGAPTDSEACGRRPAWADRDGKAELGLSRGWRGEGHWPHQPSLPPGQSPDLVLVMTPRSGRSPQQPPCLLPSQNEASDTNARLEGAEDNARATPLGELPAPSVTAVTCMFRGNSSRTGTDVDGTLAPPTPEATGSGRSDGWQVSGWPSCCYLRCESGFSNGETTPSPDVRLLWENRESWRPQAPASPRPTASGVPQACSGRRPHQPVVSATLRPSLPISHTTFFKKRHNCGCEPLSTSSGASRVQPQATCFETREDAGAGGEARGDAQSGSPGPVPSLPGSVGGGA